LLRNCAVDFVKICNFYTGKMIIKVAKRIFNSGKICRRYSDLNFGVTFLEHSVLMRGIPLSNVITLMTLNDFKRCNDRRRALFLQ